MTSKEKVKRAVEMTGSNTMPLLFLNKDREKSDLLGVGYQPAADFAPRDGNVSEWGFVWERLDDTMGQPTGRPLATWEDMDTYKLPDPHAKGRFDHMEEFIINHPDKYLMGSLGISGFNMVTFLRGFESTLEDLYLEREKIEKLIDSVFTYEEEIIKQFGRYRLDAIQFADDWGTQKSLMISPELWRQIFKPRYLRQFQLVHEMGMHIYFHSCGYVYDILPDLLEMGVDILNLNQPDLLGVERLGKDFGGKVCFNCPVDHQTTAINGTREEIFQYVKKLKDNLGCFNGGLIGYIEEYHSVGMSADNYKSIVEAFESYV